MCYTSICSVCIYIYLFDDLPASRFDVEKVRWTRAPKQVMSPNSGPEAFLRRRRATREEMEEGARQIVQSHIRMQLEAAQVPIEGSPALGLAEEPELPALEPIPSPRHRERSHDRSEATEVRTQVGGSGKGKGQHALMSTEMLGGPPRTPQRAPRGSEAASTPTPLFDERQLKQFQEIYQKAPWLYPPPMTSTMAPPRPRWREQEEKQQREEEVRIRVEEQVRRDLEMQKMRERMEDLERENQELRRKDYSEWGRTSRYNTPEEIPEDRVQMQMKQVVGEGRQGTEQVMPEEPMQGKEDPDSRGPAGGIGGGGPSETRSAEETKDQEETTLPASWRAWSS